MFVLIAAKSVVIAGGTLLALQFMRGRSASDRSWIAHLGLAALAALPLGSVLFPPLEVTASALPAPATASSAAAWIAPFAPAAGAQAAEAHGAQAALSQRACWRRCCRCRRPRASIVSTC